MRIQEQKLVLRNVIALTRKVEMMKFRLTTNKEIIHKKIGMAATEMDAE